MKNQNTICIAIMLAVAFALAPVTWGNPTPQGGPAIEPAATQQSSAEVACPLGVNCEQLPVISIHSAGNILRGKTGSFVLATASALPSGGASGASGMYVNFKVSG